MSRPSVIVSSSAKSSVSLLGEQDRDMERTEDTDRVLGEFLASTLAPRSAAARAVDKALPPVNPQNKDRISRSVFGAQWKQKPNGGDKSALLKQGGVGSLGALGEDGRARL